MKLKGKKQISQACWPRWLSMCGPLKYSLGVWAFQPRFVPIPFHFFFQIGPMLWGLLAENPATIVVVEKSG